MQELVQRRGIAEYSAETCVGYQSCVVIELGWRNVVAAVSYKLY